MTYTIWQALGITAGFFVVLFTAPIVAVGIAKAIADEISRDD